MHVGQNIKRIREAKGVTQGAIAAKIRIPRERVSNFESRPSVTTRTLERIAKGLGVQPYELLMPDSKEAA